MQDRVCLACGSRRWGYARWARDPHRPQAEAVYELLTCLSCGLIVQTPLPTSSQLREAYTLASYPPFRLGWRTPGWPLWKLLRKLTVARQMRQLCVNSRGRTLLEVGCGGGDFLLAARQAGWQVRAVEFTDSIAELLRRELHLDVRDGQLRSGLWPAESFDAIVFWNVLEHIPDPVADLTLAAQYLRDGGIILLTVPTNMAVNQGRYFGSWWTILDLPRHLYFFNYQSLSLLCWKAGLRLIAYRTPVLDILWCYYNASISYALRGEGAVIQRWLRGLVWMACAMLLLPWFLIRAVRCEGTIAVAVILKDTSNQQERG